MLRKKITVVGLGYIGLPTAAVLALHGAKVVGVDINQAVLDTVNAGKIHIVEPNLSSVVKACVDRGDLVAKLHPEPSDAFIIAVPTPFKEGSHQPDLRYVEAACKQIAPFLKRGDLVILESTSPVGATETLESWLIRERPDLSFPTLSGDGAEVFIAHCPERVLPGKIMTELVENDRIVGGLTRRCSEEAVELYKSFVKGDIVVTNARTAEMAKLTENSFRDVNIAFANELSLICEELDIDVWELIELANRHPRVDILKPGPGVGGHCIAVDPWFIVSKTPELANLIGIARQVNDHKPKWVVDQVKITAAEIACSDPSKKMSDIKIACFGASYKADIDDLRESPALRIINDLIEQNMGEILVVEPNISKLPNDISKNATLVSEDQAHDVADIKLILVDHMQFLAKRELFTSGLSKVIDTRGIL